MTKHIHELNNILNKILVIVQQHPDDVEYICLLMRILLHFGDAVKILMDSGIEGPIGPKTSPEEITKSILQNIFKLREDGNDNK